MAATGKEIPEDAGELSEDAGELPEGAVDGASVRLGVPVAGDARYEARLVNETCPRNELQGVFA